MRRREFISFIGSVAATWPLAARAQKQPARIGFLGSGAADTSAIFVEALKLGLDENGLQEGRDYVLDLGWADGNYDRFPALAEKMVQNNATVILATTISAVRSAQHALRDRQPAQLIPERQCTYHQQERGQEDRDQAQPRAGPAVRLRPPSRRRDKRRR
jgi:hypothetical protein